MKNIFLLFLILILLSVTVEAQTTTFTYQGRLTDASMAANGTYDLGFALFDAATDGMQIGAVQTRPNVNVSNGVFTVQLDFGAGVFTGANRFLEISVKRSAETDFTTLAPRQPITSTPYSIQSLNAANANNALNLDGTAASEFVKTNDSRLSDARTPIAGSANYIQNTTTQQNSANFNIDGTGTANIFNAATQFNVGGKRILSVGSDVDGNLFVGAEAGNSNTGRFNSFVGSNAGFRNSSGGSNSFFGRLAGLRNTTGSGNSFFGTEAGAGDLFGSSGSNNSFFGFRAGGNNGTGGNNTFIGVSAGFQNNSGSNNTLVGGNASTGGSNFLNFASAFGASARVEASDTIVIGKVAGNYLNPSSGVSESRPADTVRMPGSVIVSGTLQFGSFAAGFVVPVANGGTGSSTQNFVDLSNAQTIAGAKTFSSPVNASIFNATTQYNSGGVRVLSIAGLSNLFVGNQAGQVNAGSFNSFVGTNAGQSTTSGSGNSFFGFNAGGANATGSNNTAVGNGANFNQSDLTFATAVGSGAIVSTNNTVVLGRTADTVIAPNTLQVNTLGAAGSTSLCRNSANQISTCTAGNRPEMNQFAADKIDRLDEQVKQQAELIKKQQIVIDGLKKIICEGNPNADVCK